jgi:eukaryotic-like serine/threonine-protein kinase
LSIAAGSRLGPYTIIEPIGAGGMGEVVKARDTRLERIVAIKILPDAFARDQNRRERLMREAKLISQLNHPNICTLHDTGSENGVDYLVMEYVEGHTLADRLRKGPLSLEDVIHIGTEIAEALDCAHRQRIAHRDLKPGNIMLTKSGVKLLDFGLAKSMGATDDSLTADGAVVGTPRYMAPEQVEGRASDERADIFALGAVLYEMRTGKPAFAGIEPVTPPALNHLIAKCLEKDRDRRWQSAWDVAEQLRWIGQEPVVAETRSSPWKAVALTALTLLLVMSVAALYMWRNDQQRTRPDAVRLVLNPPEGWSIAAAPNRPFALSPDGKRVAFLTFNTVKGLALWVRSLASTNATMIEGTQSARNPFWSPDGQWIAFFQDQELKKVSAGGGTPVTICAAYATRGGTWSPNGTIVYANTSGVYRVRADGGTPQRLIEAGATAYYDPVFLPDGDHYLLTAFDTHRVGTILVRSLSNASEHVVIRNATNAAWIDSGHLLYVRGEELMAQRFDPEKAQLIGAPVVISPTIGVMRRESMAALFSVSRDGRVLAFQPSLSVTRSLVHVNFRGETTAELAAPERIWYPELSNDGSRLAFMIEKSNGDADIWTMDLTRSVMMRVTSQLTHDSVPVWSPDDRSLVFAAERDLYRIPAGGGTPELLNHSDLQKWPTDWSPDGRTILFAEENPETGFDIKALNVSDGTVRPVMQTRFQEHWGRFSPDGEWIAYQSNESGNREVYVQRFRDGALKTRVSTVGGALPVWSADGARLYYTGPFSVVDISFRDGVRASPPRAMFENSPGLINYTYSLFPDGRGVIGVRGLEGTQWQHIELLVDWDAALP